MKRFVALTATTLLATMMLVGCGSTSSNPNPGQSQSGNVFVTGEDAPLPSVVGLLLTINSHNPEWPEQFATGNLDSDHRGLRAPLRIAVPACLQLRSCRHLQQRDLRGGEPGHFLGGEPESAGGDSDERYAAAVSLHSDGEVPHTDGGGKQWSRRPESGIRHPAIPGRQRQRTNYRRRESGHLHKSHEGERS